MREENTNKCPDCQGEVLEADIHAMHGCALCRQCAGLFNLYPATEKTDESPEQILVFAKRLNIARDETENRLVVREPPLYSMATLVMLPISLLSVWSCFKLVQDAIFQLQAEWIDIFFIAMTLIGTVTFVVPAVKSWMVWRKFEFGPAGLEYRLFGAWSYVKKFPREKIWEVVPIEKTENAGPAYFAILRCGKTEYEIRCAARGERNKLVAAIKDYLKKSSPGRHICPECARSVPWAANDFDLDREHFCPWCKSIYLPSDAKIAGETEERDAAEQGLPLRPPLSPIRIERDGYDDCLRLRFSKWGIVKTSEANRKKTLLLLCPVLILACIVPIFVIDDIFGIIITGSMCLIILAVWLQMYAEFCKRIELIELDCSHLRLVSLHCGLFRHVRECPRQLSNEKVTAGTYYDERLNHIPVVVSIGKRELRIPTYSPEEKEWLMGVLDRQLHPEKALKPSPIVRPHCPKCQIPLNLPEIDWNLVDQMRRETGKTYMLCRECGETFRFRA